jgi:hypothetical protein
MATYSFTRLSSGTVKVVADGNTYFIPGDCKVNPNDSLNRIIITDRYGAKITMDSELDTINIAGIANTGTATEIAEDLATDIFFLASSGGGVVGISSTATETRLAISDTAFYLGGEDGAEVSSLGDINLYSTDGSGAYIQMNATNMVFGQTNALNASAFTFKNISTDVLIISANGVDNYADDAAAATGGVPVGGLYRTASALKIRVA